MEQKAAHTPGPWSLTTVPTSAGSCHKIGPFPARRPGGAPTFACVYADGIRIGIDDGMPRAIELAANARLIAAAPQLLEALQTTAENLRSWKAASNSGIKTFDSWLEVVEEAIAKAKGGAA